MNPIIPEGIAQDHGYNLLRHMERLGNPTEEQRRFIGTLRKALGLQSRNDITKRR